MAIDAAVQSKNCLIGQNKIDVQLSSIDHLKKLLTKFDPFVLVAVIMGEDEVRMVWPIVLLPLHRPYTLSSVDSHLDDF